MPCAATSPRCSLIPRGGGQRQRDLQQQWSLSIPWVRALVPVDPLVLNNKAMVVDMLSEGVRELHTAISGRGLHVALAVGMLFTRSALSS